MCLIICVWYFSLLHAIVLFYMFILRVLFYMSIVHLHILFPFSIPMNHPSRYTLAHMTSLVFFASSCVNFICLFICFCSPRWWAEQLFKQVIEQFNPVLKSGQTVPNVPNYCLCATATYQLPTMKWITSNMPLDSRYSHNHSFSLKTL